MSLAARLAAHLLPTRLVLEKRPTANRSEGFLNTGDKGHAIEPNVQLNRETLAVNVGDVFASIFCRSRSHGSNGDDILVEFFSQQTLQTQLAGSNASRSASGFPLLCLRLSSVGISSEALCSPLTMIWPPKIKISVLRKILPELMRVA